MIKDFKTDERKSEAGSVSLHCRMPILALHVERGWARSSAGKEGHMSPVRTLISYLLGRCSSILSLRSPDDSFVLQSHERFTFFQLQTLAFYFGATRNFSYERRRRRAVKRVVMTG